ncbi:MAG: PAS domain-containing protein, partial [Planctomycetes bacterium]|nr:PAS domain-containing protein [Planctomycetota bacterium]
MRSRFFWSQFVAFAGVIAAFVVAGALGGFFAGVGGSLVAAFLLAWRAARPIVSMSRAARRIAAGEYHRAVPVETRDEVGRLARAFNETVAELRRRIEGAEQDRQKVVAILGGMVEGVVAVDRGERVAHMNAVAGELLRVTPEAAIGRHLWEVARVSQLSEAVAEVLAGRGEQAREARLAGRPKETVIEVHASPLRGPTGSPVGAVLVLHDVTTLRRLEEVRRDFVANVSHELKTPLTAIRGLVETVLDDQAMDPETRGRFLSRVLAQTQRLTRLVADLLDLSRVESGEAPFERRRMDLSEPLRESVRRHAAWAADREIALAAECPPAPVAVEADPEAIRQILDNLLDNALGYTPAGGRVAARAAARGTEAVIEVSDTGIGIQAEHLDRIFERFYRVDKARSREAGGTGLGLSIVKHLAITLGGRVAVESVFG